MNLTNILLIFATLAYFFYCLNYFSKKQKQEEALKQITNKTFVLYFWETKITDIIEIDAKYYRTIFIPLRILMCIGALYVSFKLGVTILFFVSAIIIALFMDNKTKILIEEAGIKYIENINLFLDFYVPALASGQSNNQAMLKFIGQENDPHLTEWWINKDSKTFVVNNKWKRVIEIYEMMKFNEERGIDNSLPVIEEMQKDLSQKQVFYNEYSSKMGEITPILLSYYIFVPVLLVMSINQTQDFWFSFKGLIATIVLIILFLCSQFAVFKLREHTIKTLF